MSGGELVIGRVGRLFQLVTGKSCGKKENKLSFLTAFLKKAANEAAEFNLEFNNEIWIQQ